MSELKAEQSGDETGSHGAGSPASNATDSLIDRVMATAQDVRSVASPEIVPDHGVAKASDEAETEMPKAEASSAEAPAKAEMPKSEPFTVEAGSGDAKKEDIAKQEHEAPKNAAARIEPAKIEPVRAEPQRGPRELLIMSPREGSWKRNEGGFERRDSEPKAEQQAQPARNGGRRFAAMAAMLLLAVIAGAAGGAFATVGLSHRTETAAAPAPDQTALEASIARIDADITALKAGLEQTAKAGLAQFNKTSDRLEHIEKAQAEPAQKLAKLSDAVEKLRAAAAAPAAPATVAAVTPKEATGTVSAPAGAQALPMPQASPAVANAGTTPKVEVGRLPTVEGWVLRDAGRGSALIEGRTGLYEVFAGDPIPGVGRVEAIRKQDGRWVVVTPKGLIVAR